MPEEFPASGVLDVEFLRRGLVSLALFISLFMYGLVKLQWPTEMLFMECLPGGHRLARLKLGKLDGVSLLVFWLFKVLVKQNLINWL
jgi:hypothetical protein